MEKSEWEGSQVTVWLLCLYKQELKVWQTCWRGLAAAGGGSKRQKGTVPDLGLSWALLAKEGRGYLGWLG